MSRDNITEIRICMGSSCYSRGNKRSLEIIQHYMQENQIEANVELCGCLCEGQCTSGPNITINKDQYTQVDPNSVIDILNYYFRD